LAGLSPRAVPWAALGVGIGSGFLGCGVLLAGGQGSPLGATVGLTVLVAGSALLAAHRRSDRLGWANSVTLARLVGLCWITALTTTMVLTGANPRRVATIVVLALICLALDGVDGHVARSRGEVSDFGARFDMETDAAMIMVLCVAVAVQGSVGWWVLAIGLARYAYWLCSLRVPALNLPVAPSILRKIVAVAQSAALLICLALGATGIGPAWLPSAVAAIALAGLGWSFVSVTIWQLRTARAPRTP
jgi:phosphatidylglycerophosphate synthase